MPVAESSHHARPRTALVVLGMHRSGTSALTRVLNLCGAALPKQVLPQKADNVTGFWEPAAAALLNDRLLGKLGSDWLDFAALGSERLDSLADELPAIAEFVRGAFGEEPLLVLKEPRLCRLAPLWTSALQRLGIQSKFLLPIRNPLEIAGSLASRDRLSRQHALMLWLRYLLDSESHTEKSPRCFVRYEELVRDWRPCLQNISRELDVDLTPDASAEQNIDAFLRPDLRHHRATDRAFLDDPEISDWVKQGYRWALAQTRKPGSKSRQLEQCRNSLATAERGYGAAWRERVQACSTLLSERQTELREARENAERLITQITEARRSNELRDEAEAAMRAALEDRDNQLDRARTNIAALVAEIDSARVADRHHAENEGALRRSLAERDSEINLARENIDGLIAELAQAREHNAGLAEQISTARNTINELSAEIEEARQSHAWRDAIEGDLRNAKRESEAQSESLAAQVGTLSKEIEAARRSHRARDQIESDLREKLQKRTAEIEHARGQIEALSTEIRAARNAHQAHDENEAALHRELEQRLTEIARAGEHIKGLAAEIEQARISHKARDATEAHLRRQLEDQGNELCQTQKKLAERDMDIFRLSRRLDAIQATWPYRLWRLFRRLGRS